MTRMTPSNRLPKTRRAPRQAPNIKLTDRDRAVLYDLYHYRYLPTSLIVRRHFGSETRGRTRLRLLFHHGYLDRHFLPTVGPSLGEAIYGLGPKAVGELAVVYGLEPADIRRRRRAVEPFFLEHRLAIARFRIAVTHAGAPFGVGLYDWREDVDARLQTPDGERVIPDGVGWVRSRRARFAFALEADRGTMTVGRVAAKFDRYRALGRVGLAPIAAERFRVLVTAPSERRLDSLLRAAERAQLPAVWLATEAAIWQADPIRDAIWAKAGRADRLPLLRPGQLGSGPTSSSPRPSTQGGSA